MMTFSDYFPDSIIARKIHKYLYENHEKEGHFYFTKNEIRYIFNVLQWIIVNSALLDVYKTLHQRLKDNFNT